MRGFALPIDAVTASMDIIRECPDLEPFVNTRPNIAKVINDLVWPWSSKHFLLSLYLTNTNFNTFLVQDHLSVRTLKKFSFFVICNALFQVKQIFLTHLLQVKKKRFVTVTGRQMSCYNSIPLDFYPLRIEQHRKDY